MTTLHIIATPRGTESRTLQVSNALLEHKHDVETLSLFDIELPALDNDAVIAVRQNGGGHPTITTLINQFLAADTIVISTPMWNFSIPYVLKHYIDCIVQPGQTFQYVGNVIEGLATGKTAYIVTSRGGDYELMPQFDFQTTYLTTILAFIGITDVQFIHAQPMDIDAELRAFGIQQAHATVSELFA